MACKVLKTGQQQLLTDALAGGSLENWQLRLFSTTHTPAVTDTLSTYTAIEATFAGYSIKTLTRTIAGGTWGAVALTGTTIDGTNHNAISTYGTTQTWNATSAQTIYGHFWGGATSGVGILAELWGSSVALVNPSTLNLVPLLELGSA
jgi:hypothetical protein